MELGRSMARTLRLAVAAVLLLLVALHATAPFSAPLERASGSAFSAATVDVSLGATQQHETEKRIAGITPAPIPTASPTLFQYSAPSAAGLPHARPDVRGPPAWPIAASPLAPRAPPAA